MILTNMEYYRDEILDVTFIGEMHHSWPRHSHPQEFQIILVFDGKFEVDFPKCTVALTKDTFLVVPPQCVHEVRTITPAKILFISIAKTAVDQDTVAVLDMLDKLVEVLQQKGLIETKHLILLSRAESQILCAYRTQTDVCTEFVAEVRKILEQTPQENISADKMSKIASKCKDHLAREFKKEVGLSPHQFQIQNRIRKATWLLVGTGKSIGEIVRECGFYDSSHFSRHFRRLLGMSPKSYRDEFRQAKPLFTDLSA